MGSVSRSYHFGTPLVGDPGASYRLCWAHNASGAQLADFAVELDPRALLSGPRPVPPRLFMQQDARETCVLFA